MDLTKSPQDFLISCDLYYQHRFTALRPIPFFEIGPTVGYYKRSFDGVGGRFQYLSSNLVNMTLDPMTSMTISGRIGGGIMIPLGEKTAIPIGAYIQMGYLDGFMLDYSLKVSYQVFPVGVF